MQRKATTSKQPKREVAPVREALEPKEVSPQSFLEAAGPTVGSVDGPADLSTNDEHLESNSR